ncbi:hypothetical protein [Andreprevotia chitinilytica]|uniref:hypothetical protein n=1 Tax=Andreprevotia chitinilytica TaxID=396808 RepID=UPI001470740B|nr:hypothetical protein [Andreprevotia chitinilytica]
MIRLLFLLAVLVIGFGTFKYQRTRDRYWLRLIRWTIFIVLGALLIMFIGLAVDRLEH